MVGKGQRGSERLWVWRMNEHVVVAGEQFEKLELGGDVGAVVGVPILEREGLPPMDVFGVVIAGMDERREAEPSDAVFGGVIDAADNRRIDSLRQASKSKLAAVNDARSCSTQT